MKFPKVQEVGRGHELIMAGNGTCRDKTRRVSRRIRLLLVESPVSRHVNNVFSQLILDVKDLDDSLRFYHDMLKLPVRRQDDWDGHRLAYLRTGATEILLVQQPEDEQNPLLDRSGGLVINFKVANLPVVAESLEKQHVKILRGLEMAIWGERTFLVADPDGYAVLLSEPVGTVH